MFLLACEKVTLHDEVKAIRVANKFLKLDLAGQYQEAYALCDTGFTEKVDFDTFVKKDSINKDPNLGKMKRAEFKYFMVVGAQKYIELIYNCDFEKISGVPLHFILSGSMIDGYKITVIDVGYSYKTFGKDEDERPRLTVSDSYIVEP